MTEAREQRSEPVLHETARRPRALATLLTLAVCAALAFAGFVALGTWQLYRLQWKLALIQRVEQRVHAAPVPAPGPARWPDISAESDEYRHVRLTGTFLYDLTTRVQALTELGSGFWLLTPLRTADGNIVLVNRGFVPAAGSGSAEQSGRSGTSAPRPAGSPGGETSTVTGLLRMSEPGGAFLRHNDPQAGRWYSRDVAAIAAAHGLSHVAPYFVDADAARGPGGTPLRDAAPDRPVGGLTVVTFHNNHLVYALTWYALALMVAGAFWWLAREERKLRRAAQASLGGTQAGALDREREHGG